jgi:magnesium chelatase subunit I
MLFSVSFWAKKEINLSFNNPSLALDIFKIKTLGELKSSGWKSKSIKEEIRQNLIARLKDHLPVFEGIYGYEDTVIPELERALLSRHNINLLGLRGQAKTRLARLMTHLLDEYIPVIEGSELNDDPLNPITSFGKQKMDELGDLCPVAWWHRDERYTEKLATPDVTVADLIGDVDPIKAASLKLPYSDERVIHYGLIPRSHRGIFVINELPDLQARIQVALFNILQEGDIQIRGFKLRLPLDIQFVFTSNPEDYTNRGSIVTPLKDRIDSQIITHYPGNLEIGKKITSQEAIVKEGQEKILVPDLAKDLIEQVAVEARHSEFVDAKSGVSARMTISAFENLLSTVERRSILNGESGSVARLIDLFGIMPAITGKVELVYEGEQEGAPIVARNLIGKAIRTLFIQYFPDPEKAKKKKEKSPFQPISDYFSDGKWLTLGVNEKEEEYRTLLDRIPGLDDLIFDSSLSIQPEERFFWKEFVLFGLAEFSVISKKEIGTETRFGDLLGSMLDLDNLEMEEEDE